MLPSIKCPQCKKTLSTEKNHILPASNFKTCLRKCINCGIGFSNAKNSPTKIYEKPAQNIPASLTKNVEKVLRNSVNERNRLNKLNKFCFSTSEDALTWSTFIYLLNKNRLSDLMSYLNIETQGSGFLYLWGVDAKEPNNISNTITQSLKHISFDIGENTKSMTDPDVIIHFPNSALIFIEVKYQSGNEINHSPNKLNKYINHDPYLFKDNVMVYDSGHYELIRNWVIGNSLISDTPFYLINLGYTSLFNDKNQKKLELFSNSLNCIEGKRVFRKVSWEYLLNSNLFSDSDILNYLNDKLKIK